MIFNNRKLLLSPELAEVLMDAEEVWQELSKTGNKILIISDKYRGLRVINGKKIYLVREILRLLYYYKCAYCETKEYLPDIEHYRPKKGVTKLKKGHPGYYWLCYEWTNLLPACRSCNSGSGKWNKFPIIGVRVMKPSFLPSGELDKDKCRANHSPLIDEKPYLLHPEIDDPKPCFKFYKNGKIEGVDSQGRGAETIRICDLDRDNLRYRRKKLLDDFKEEIEHDLKLYMNKKMDDTGLRDAFISRFEKLDNLCQPHQEFSLTAIYAREHFDQMIVPLITFPTYQKAVSDAFKMYLNGTL